MRPRILGPVALVLLLSGVQLPADGRDHRLVDAAKNRDSLAVASLLKEGVRVDATQPDAVRQHFTGPLTGMMRPQRES